MTWVRDPALLLPPYPCEEARETAIPRGRVAHFLPGQSPLPGLKPHFTDRFGDADRCEAGRTRNDVSGVHREDEEDAAPAGAGSLWIGGPRAMRPLMLSMAGVACLGVLASPEHVYTQAPRAGAVAWPPPSSAPAPGEVQVLPVQGNVHMLVGAGANITVQAGAQGILLVDTGIARMSDKVLAAASGRSSAVRSGTSSIRPMSTITPAATPRSRRRERSFPSARRTTPPARRVRSIRTRRLSSHSSRYFIGWQGPVRRRRRRPRRRGPTTRTRHHRSGSRSTMSRS